MPESYWDRYVTLEKELVRAWNPAAVVLQPARGDMNAGIKVIDAFYLQLVSIRSSLDNQVDQIHRQIPNLEKVYEKMKNKKKASEDEVAEARDLLRSKKEEFETAREAMAKMADTRLRELSKGKEAVISAFHAAKNVVRELGAARQSSSSGASKLQPGQTKRIEDFERLLIEMTEAMSEAGRYSTASIVKVNHLTKMLGDMESIIAGYGQ
jgi:chromosome segregation ATPase